MKVVLPQALVDQLRHTATLADVRASGGTVAVRAISASPEVVVSTLGAALPFAARHQDAAGSLEELERALIWTECLAQCPVCPRRAKEWLAQDGDTFYARCQACRTSWGIDHCTSGHRRPFIRLDPASDQGADVWSLAAPDRCCANGG